MFKFFVFCVILWQAVTKGILGKAIEGFDTEVPSFATSDLSKQNTSTIGTDGKSYTFHATQQIFYLGSGPMSFNDNPRRATHLPVGYVAINGITAHKLHRRKLNWASARRTCNQEGGHLAIIRTEAEQAMIQQLMKDNDIQSGIWVGFHDLFNEGEWLSVLDEPMAQTGWAKWSTMFSNNPDNFKGSQHCARFLNDGGLDDDFCNVTMPFVCKIEDL